MTKVLDHGEVILVDHMAGDHKVFGAARVSTKKRPEDSSKGRESDAALIAFLMKNGHGTPFEHAVFQFFVKAPIFVVREWQRHRIASYNEQSGRYAEFEPEFYTPDVIRVQDEKNKQSSVPYDENEYPAGKSFVEAVQFAFTGTAELAFNSYRQMLGQNVAREMARMILPINLYTSFWFTVNARSLMNFVALRNAPAAQWEIQQYAKAIEAEFAAVMPVTHAAFVDNGRVAP